LESSDQTDLPRQFDRYELLERLPGAGMSKVYRARTVIGKTVLVKTLPRQDEQSEARARFLEEAKIAASLSHENIVSVYDYGEFDQLPYMVMEFLCGETLESIIGEGGTIGDRRSLEIGLQVARALEFVHEHNVVHRDIKPSNIFVTKAGVVKLIDFGVAKGADAMLQTQAGIALGTIFYMAPEQVEGQRTPSVDIWAFGLLLFEMLTGKRAIDGNSVENILYKILHEPVNLEPLRQSAAGMQVFDLIQRCVARQPSARPQCFTQIAVELELLLHGSPTPVQEFNADSPSPAPELTPPWWRTSHIRVIASVVIGLLVFLGLAFAVMTYFQSPIDIDKGQPKGDSKAVVDLPPPPPPSPRISLSSGDLLLVPEGEFLFGEDAKPSFLPAFYIDETEVTERAYRDLAGAQKIADPNRKAAENLPVTGITFKEARDFCMAAGKRLPSAEEWEKAARGVDGRPYPWGNQEDASLANVALDKPRGLQPVGSFPGGRSPYGALDMAGNAWEFVDTRLTEANAKTKAFAKYSKSDISSGSWNLIYGSSYAHGIRAATINDPAAVEPDVKSNDIGFRCARDASLPVQN
jgi:serine/threonine protein kinase